MRRLVRSAAGAVGGFVGHRTAVHSASTDGGSNLRFNVGARVEALTNLGWLDGTVTEAGDQYRIRLDAGATVQLPSNTPEEALREHTGWGEPAEASAELVAWMGRFDNTLMRDLECGADVERPQNEPRRVGGHWLPVQPLPLKSPLRMVSVSSSCADLVGLAPETASDPAFLEVMAGSWKPDGATYWAANYGCSVNGLPTPEQRGDGRAMSIGEIVCPDGVRRELQLKGTGATPFCRGFEGRAVLRSSVRELLASEGMHALGVPTTRALSLVASDSPVLRRWHTTRLSQAQGNHNPEGTVLERAAVLCRVSPSFLRFATVELFWVRGDFDRMRAVLDHAIAREFAELSSVSDDCERYARLFEKVVVANAELVAEWLRVGYVQGNMNSDNMTLGGRTLDYGPFGFLDVYDASYHPWTGGPQYCYNMQPVAMQKNLKCLAEGFAGLLDHLGGSTELRKRVRHAADEAFSDAFGKAHHDNCRRKIGLQTYDTAGRQLFSQFQHLCHQSPTDFFIAFRALSRFPVEADDIISALEPAWYQGAPQGDLRRQWLEWGREYAAQIGREKFDERVSVMDSANPKWVPRGWMLTEAAESAQDGDDSAVEDALSALRHPYSDQPDRDQRWAGRAPPWAVGAPGVSTMS
eukprot:TRINITY_DN1429_c7_g1_i2.p1 TRINITY_DN1429_c7_g1~~TRINITY_DN1429_c7_g1_i2.p1  ORF type:complete len:638 (+),score=130.37 TRINITY_DN1429_c7_g1_i2:47-1960(+)